MSSVTATVVEAVKELLKAAPVDTFLYTFEPQRVYSVDLKSHEDDNLHVDLKHAPNDIRVESEDRGSIVYRIPVLICVRKHFSESDEGHDALPAIAELDGLAELTEQIAEYFAETRIAAGDTVSVEPGEMASLAPQDALRTYGQFFGCVKVICQATKTL